MKVEYKSNNSGGRWWLKDSDWVALEKAGWKVAWVREGRYTKSQLGKDGRWLGCPAKEASKEFPSLSDAIRDWEQITGGDASDEGCNCCGPPHSFHSGKDYCSGEECLSYLFPGKRAAKTKRELLEESS